MVFMRSLHYCFPVQCSKALLLPLYMPNWRYLNRRTLNPVHFLDPVLEHRSMEILSPNPSYHLHFGNFPSTTSFPTLSEFPSHYIVHRSDAQIQAWYHHNWLDTLHVQANTTWSNFLRRICLMNNTTMDTISLDILWGTNIWHPEHPCIIW